jgi:hypothetical protein
MTEGNWLSNCEWKESKEIIDKHKSRRILGLKKTSTAPHAIIKKGQNNNVILMGEGMKMDNNSDRSSNTKERIVSKH